MERKTQSLPPARTGQGLWQRGQWLGLFRHNGRFRKLLLVLIMLFSAAPLVKAGDGITDLLIIACPKKDNENTLKTKYINNGWTIVKKGDIDQDLNAGAGGYWIYLCYKKRDGVNPETDYITDIRVSNEKKKSIEYQQRTYYLVNYEGRDFNGDLNQGASGDYLFLYCTTQRKGYNTNDPFGGSKRIITNIWANEKASDGKIVFFGGDACEFNKGAGGDWIYLMQTFAVQKVKMTKEPTFYSEVVFNGQAQSLVSEAPQLEYGTMKYSVNGGSWSESATAKDVGEYTVKYRLDGVNASGQVFADNSDEKTASHKVKIIAPNGKPNITSKSYSSDDGEVIIKWTANVPGGYKDYKWVVYRGTSKLGTVSSNSNANYTYSYTDKNYVPDADNNYSIYYVSNTWPESTKNDSCKADVTVKTTLSLPVNGLKAEYFDDDKNDIHQITLSWTSDKHKLALGHKFYVYIDNEATPVDTIIPTSEEQVNYKWIHRSTTAHTNRQNIKLDGVDCTEEPLTACGPHNYTVVGVIGDNPLKDKATLNNISIGTGTKILSVKASKGAYPGMVKLNWQVDLANSSHTRTYIIERRSAEQESEPWTTLTSMTSSDEYVFYTDDIPQPGVYYDYRVTVREKCGDGKIIESSLGDIGFAQTTGTVSGRVTFGSSGASVEGVAIEAQQTGESASASQYHSYHFTAGGSSISWDYPSDSYAQDKFANGDFSIQLWINPEEYKDCWFARFRPGNSSVASVALSMWKFDENDSSKQGQLLFCDGNENRAFNLHLQKDAYNHVTLTRKGNTLICYLVQPDSAGIPRLAKDTVVVEGGLNLDLSSTTAFQLGFVKGYFDDFRLWTKCLSEDEILENYDHLLVGNEKNLETYFTFDEGLKYSFFDYSREGTVYHEHHGKVVSNVDPSTFTPAELALKARTDKDGNYIIHGIPFTGEGTTYAIIPRLGIHKFNPTQQLRYVGNNSLVHNGTDFEDISSFPVSGTIYYAGTDYPVEGVNFYVDGQPCTRNGEMIATNAKGEYTISVPIGDHFIQVAKNGHVFADNGRYPEDPFEQDSCVTFKEEVKFLNFYDETLVNFTGRVVGGDIEGRKNLGFGLSKNTIGQAEMILMPAKNEYRLNVIKDKGETSFALKENPEDVTVASATPLVNSTSVRNGGKFTDCQKITIKTDPATGEFSAMLPPIIYEISSLQVINNDEIKFESLPQVDLSNPNYEWADTLYNDDGEYELYKYNTSLKQTYHSKPTFTVKQEGRDDGSFGINSYKIKDEQGELTINDIYSVKDGKVTYKYYDSPIFVMEDQYTFKLKGYENYTNADTGEDFEVPLDGVVVTINNALSADQAIYVEDGTVDGQEVKAGQLADLKPNQLQLDSLGCATYKWKAGLPNIIEPYKRTINMSYFINGAPIDWDGNGMTGIILGDLPTGNNFVTAGPDKLLMILRDPPGSASSAEWSTGSSTTTSKLRGNTFTENAGVKFEHKFGFKAMTIVGTPGVGTITEAEAKDDLTLGAKMESSGENSTTTSTTTTVTTAISTSDSPDFVGADGDVYIGTSTNIIFGNARDLGFRRTSGNEVELGVQDIISTGIDFKTMFSYTQHYIENTLFPNFELLRRNLLKTKDQATIDSYKNPNNFVVYYTTLSEDDENFGKPGTYTAYPPAKIEPGKHYEDSVKWLTSQIENWKKYLAINDSAKVEAYKGGKQYLVDSNISFDGGTSISSSTEVESSKTTTWDWTVSAGLVVENSFGFEINKFGIDCTIEDETTGGRHETDEEENATTTSFSYTLAEEDADDALSVDIYQFDAYGPIFRTRGGQTSNPYEGEVVTQYYEPGTVIMEATMQIEVPQIDVEEPIVNDVPTGGAANYTIHLGNASEIGADVTYTLFVLDETNPNGAQLSIDGKVLTGGRLIKVPGNQSLTKALQLRQTNQSILDYEEIGIVFASESQPEEIADTIFISAYFVPSSSPVDLALSKTTINSETTSDLTLTFSNFDRSYRGLKSFRLQYKKPGATDWMLLHEYMLNPAEVTSTTQEALPATGSKIAYPLDMSDYPDGDYLFRVISVSDYGTEEVYNTSKELAFVKDVMRPRPLGQPEPADGILDIGDELSITFNEAFVKGLLTKEANFEVTGVLNGATIDHETALSMQDTEGTAATEATITLANKDFSTDMWVNIEGAGTILSHGNGTTKFTIGTNAEGKLVVDIAGNTYTSADAIPTNKWAFLAMSYKAGETGGKFSASVATDDTTTDLFFDKDVVSYEGSGPLAVGKNLKGAIHELLLWDEAHNITTALQNRSKSKNPSTRHLIGYWKMNEGEGTTIRDYARNRHMTMSDETWYLNNENKAINLDGTKYMSVAAGDLPVQEADDYAIEFWMRGDAQSGEAQLLQMGEVSLWTNADGQLQLTGKGAYNEAEGTVLATNSASLTDNAWHHIALNVLRQGAAAVYVDGARVLTTTAAKVGGINTDNLFMGVRRNSISSGADYSYDRAFKGQIDELRIWNASMNATQLANNRKVRLTGKEAGLMLYFPFEKKRLDSGNQVITEGLPTDLTGKNKEAKITTLSSQASSISYVDEAPALRTKPTETNVSFNYTASDTKIVIELDEDPAIIDGCTLNFVVKNVRDANGNFSEPTLWSAFVNQNELEWAEGALDCIVDVTSSADIAATVVNKSGKQQMWSLSGMPAWLTANIVEGSTNPLQETTVIFTVAEATPIGDYEETIYLTGNNGIETPLTINVKVVGDEPLWAVDANDYEESMNVIATLEISGVLSEDTDDMVAAFVDDECRGVAKPVYEPRYDTYYVTMDIYGNLDEAGKNIQFKAYDSSTGVIYPVVNITTPDGGKSISFEANSFIGRYATPVLLTSTDDIEQLINLNKGWNWMSFAVKPSPFSPENVFAKANGAVTFIKDKKNSSSYDPTDGWFGRLTEMNNTEMYAVKTDEALSLGVNGVRINPADEPITVGEGWNWVAFNSLSVMSLGDALADLQPVDGDMIKGQKGVAYFDEFEWIGSLRQLTPGQGYKIKSAASSERKFSYPSITASSGPRTAPMRINDAPTVDTRFKAIDYSLYPTNMVLIAKVVDGSLPAANVELGVFAGTECREAVFTDNNGMVYITVPGDDNEVTLDFYVARDGQLYRAGETVTYQPDAVYGAPRNPLLINIGNATAVDGTMAGQDAETIYDLSGRKLNSEWSKTQLHRGVYIVNGKKQVKK